MRISAACAGRRGRSIWRLGGGLLEERGPLVSPVANPAASVGNSGCISTLNTYDVDQAPASPRSPLRQRYAHQSGPRTRSASVSTSVAERGSQRVPRASAVSRGLLRYGFWKWRGRKGSIPTGDSRQGQAERREGHDDIDGAESHTLG